VKEEDGVGGEAGARRGRNPPGVEAGLAGVGDVEVDFLVAEAGGGGGGGDGVAGVKEELPLALVEEESEGCVSTEDG
jgi:hypothetical protein